MDLSLAGLLGATLGIIAAALVYGPLVAAIERRLRGVPGKSEDRPVSAPELALLRRGVFMADILLCAGFGYWVGQKLAG
jgi:hypothetical protein